MDNKQITGNLLGLVLMIFLLPLRWLYAAIIAALIHELGHYCAVYFLGGSIHRIKIGSSGAIMEASGLTNTSELISLLAGPLIGLLPMLVVRVFPTIALCGLVQSLYNLIPVYPLDGGRILRCVVLTHGGPIRCIQIIENSATILLCLFCIYIRLRFGISLFLFLGVFLFRKTPCK